MPGSGVLRGDAGRRFRRDVLALSRAVMFCSHAIQAATGTCDEIEHRLISRPTAIANKGSTLPFKIFVMEAGSKSTETRYLDNCSADRASDQRAGDRHERITPV